MKLRFQADADLDGRVLRGLRRATPEIDIRTAADAGLAGLIDLEVLRLAAVGSGNSEPFFPDILNRSPFPGKGSSNFR